jgi:lipoate-protein ligase A
MRDYEYWGTGTFSIHDNMALEEYLLDRSAVMQKTTVRFWNVKKDAVVLGYGESTGALKKRDGTFDIARRITGGSHVQFDSNCLAYTITAPRDGTFGYFDEMRKHYAELIANAMTELGIEVSKVDNRASTINVDGKVMASHAMFWGVKSALMHGLVVVNNYDVDKILERVALNERKIGRHTYSEYNALKSIPVASDLMGSRIERVNSGNRLEYAKTLIASSVLKSITGGAYSEKTPVPSIIDAARDLVSETHVGTPWFEERKPNLTSETVDAIPGETLDGRLRLGMGYCLYIEVPDKDFKNMSEPVE